MHSNFRLFSMDSIFLLLLKWFDGAYKHWRLVHVLKQIMCVLKTKPFAKNYLISVYMYENGSILNSFPILCGHI